MIIKHSEFVKKLIKENIEPREVFVGYHCSEKNIINFNGDISTDYCDRYEIILKNIKDEYKEANKYYNIIQTDGIEYGSDLAEEIHSFFEKIGINWIFVDENEPLTRYGNNCYSVYFKNMDNVFSIQDFNEEDSNYSFIYFYYKKNEPILKKININI